MGLRETLGEAHGGKPLSVVALGRFLRENYLENPHEVARVAEAKKRDELFDNRGDYHMMRMLQTAFSDPITRKLRSDLVAWAKVNNVVRRIATELATVYSEPAKRRVRTGDEVYQRFLERLNLDAIMREVDEKCVLHEDVWVQYRVRKGTLQPVVDVISPARFWAIHDPADATALIAVIVDQGCRARDTDARYRVWTVTETFVLDGRGRPITSSWEEHALGRLPGVLVSVRPATAKGKLLTDTPAADLVAAHEAVWFQHVLLLKESKSANKQLYHTGDTSNAAMGQTADTESDVILPEGVSTQAIDRGLDLSQFQTTATYFFESAAANRGLPPAVLHQRDAASGAEIHLRRIPIRELRKKRIPIMRAAERDLAELMSLANETDLPEFAFSAEGFAIDYGEVQQPLTEAELDAVFEQRRRLGLTDTLEEIRRRNPDLRTDEEAETVLKGHVEVEAKRVEMMQKMMAMSGAMGAASDGSARFQKPRGDDGDDEPDGDGSGE